MSIDEGRLAAELAKIRDGVAELDEAVAAAQAILDEPDDEPAPEPEPVPEPEPEPAPAEEVTDDAS